jgi:2-polyprenyl-3-methyl-5-hydroxy-6-metoxy-1,4-benzoquinol methylase
MPLTDVTVKPCAICGEPSQDVELLYHLLDYDVLICRRCGLAYVNQTFETEKGEGIPEGYDAIYLPAERSFLARFEHNLEHIEDVVNDGRGKICDIGCGVGYFLRVAQERGWAVAGIDLDKAAVDIARQHGIDVRWETVEEMSFSDDEFNVVTLFNVIEHVPAPQIVLGEIRRVLKPSGLFVLETPTDDFRLKHPIRLLYRLSGGKITQPIRYLYSSRETGGHIYRFSRETITKILEKMGFDVQKIVPGENPPFRLYLSKQNFQKSWPVKAANFLAFGLVFGLVKLVGLHSRMVVYARKV